MRAEALQQPAAPPSWALERVRRYGVVGLFPGAQQDFPFILYAQSVPRPAWIGKRDVHRDTLHRVYACLLAARAERLDDETVEPIVSLVDTNGHVPAATSEGFQWPDTANGVNHASGAVCPGLQ